MQTGYLWELQRSPHCDAYLSLHVTFTLFSGHVELCPHKESAAMHDAICLYDYMSRYGKFDEIRADPSADFKSKTLEQLSKWRGFTHTFR